MSLFNLQQVTLHSGAKSDWIIDCEALTDGDLAALALVGSRMVGEFSKVIGVPNGGLRFARALEQYAIPTSPFALIVDDVLTTGTSMEEMRRKVFGAHNVTGGLVIFARGDCPSWVTPIWRQT